MKIKDYSLEVTIGLPDFSNIKPNITLTDVDSFEEAHAEASKYLNSIWQGTPNAKIDSPFSGGTTSSNAKKVECLVGGSILYDPVAHVYTNDKGEVYLSGSQYAKKFDKETDFGAIAGKMTKNHPTIETKDLVAMWKLRGEISASFGTTAHQALEMYGKYKDISEKLGKEYHLSPIPMVRKIVDDFFKGRESEKAIYEPMVVDHDRKWAGQIDRLVVTGDKKCIIGDYKTNSDMTPAKIETYTHQLSFYASIMESGGWTVEGLELYHLDGVWKTIKLTNKGVK